MRILVVEDDPKIASFVEMGLRESSYAVDVAGDGEVGLTLARKGHYDAAVVDIMLPGMDGIEMIQRLREEGVLTPVLILSAKRSVDDRIHGLQSGGDRLRRQAVLARRGPRPDPGLDSPGHADGRAHDPAGGDVTMDLVRREGGGGKR